MMGINKGSSTALCFVVDTTGSMAEEITAVKTAISSTINSKVGTEDEPSSYILVPFSDPSKLLIFHTDYAIVSASF